MDERRGRRRDPVLQERARRMRREPTEPEIRLWRALSNRRLGGHKFRRQSPIPPFIGDFFCPAIGLVVGVDGHTHSARSDASRDQAIRTRGLHVFRTTNADVMTNMEGVLSALLRFADSLPTRTVWASRTPHPNPSPEGEGL